MLKCLIRRWLMSLIPEQPRGLKPARPTSRFEVTMKGQAKISITLECPVCDEPLQGESVLRAWCVNPRCPICLDVCRITFQMQSLKERGHALSPPS